MIYYYRYLLVKMKVFNYSELHFAEVTFYKIHTLASTVQCPLPKIWIKTGQKWMHVLLPDTLAFFIYCPKFTKANALCCKYLGSCNALAYLGHT